jgi:hypothetical protein
VHVHIGGGVVGETTLHRLRLWASERPYGAVPDKKVAGVYLNAKTRVRRRRVVCREHRDDATTGELPLINEAAERTGTCRSPVANWNLEQPRRRLSQRRQGRRARRCTSDDYWLHDGRRRGRGPVQLNYKPVQTVLRGRRWNRRANTCVGAPELPFDETLPGPHDGIPADRVERRRETALPIDAIPNTGR